MSDDRQRPKIWADMKPREQIEWDRLTDMIGWLREMRVRLEKVQYARNARKKEQGE